MKIGRHGLRDHLRLLAPLFGLITAVWALRLIMDLADTPPALVRMVSVSVTGAVAVLVAVTLIHFKRFGGYASVVLAAFLLIGWAQLIIVFAIALTAWTGWVNVYSSPEYTYGATHLQHIAGHLTLGLGMEGIFASMMGCVLLWVLRRLVPIKDLSKSGRHIIPFDSASEKKPEG
jgi:hypothetical protein